MRHHKAQPQPRVLTRAHGPRSLWAAVVAIALFPIAGQAAPAVTDLLPDIVVRENDLYDHDVVVGTIEPGRTHLRLSNGTANIGAGKLYLYGVLPGNPDGTQDVRQRIWRSDGSFYDRPAGRFIYHPTHDHIHVEDWSIYRLRTVLAGGGVGAIVAEGEKTSFCILDVSVYNSSLPGWSPFPQFDSCNGTAQGLSIGWADVYTKGLPGQNLDITGLPDGIYWLESEVDPLDHILERDETNNVARVQIAIGAVGPATPDLFEPNSTIAAVETRPPGGPNSPNLGPCGPVRVVTPLSIHQSGDDDVYRFYANHTGTSADFVRIGFDDALGNLDLRVFNAAGVQVGASTGHGNQEQVSLSGAPEGWYHARVFGASGATNPFYSLTIDPPQNGAPSLTVVAPPAGNVDVQHGSENYIAQWTVQDPEGDPTWVTVSVNAQPAFDGNEVLLPTTLNVDGALGFAVINSAELSPGTYWVYCQVTDAGTIRGSWSAGTVTFVESGSGVGPAPGKAQPIVRVLPAVPNPFNPRTRLALDLARAGDVRWEIVDLRGRRVRRLADGWLPAGVSIASWDGTDDRGRRVGSGVYVQRADAGGVRSSGKLVLVE